MSSRIRIANEAWEALFRAQATIARELTAGDVWGDLAPHEYGVLYALSTAPDGLMPAAQSPDTHSRTIASPVPPLPDAAAVAVSSR